MSRVEIVQELDNLTAEIASFGTNLELINRLLEEQLFPTDETISIWAVTYALHHIASEVEGIRDSVDPF